MKKIEAIIRPEKLDELVEQLEISGYSGLTITQVEGHGRQKGITEQFRGKEYTLKFIPKVKVVIVTTDDKVEDIIDTIIAIAKTDNTGDGKIFISEVLDVIRVRTKERGVKAI